MEKSLYEPSSIYPDFSVKQLDVHMRCQSIAGLLPTWVKRGIVTVQYLPQEYYTLNAWSQAKGNS